MNQDFLDLLRAFIDRNVRFLIVGAYALAVHGRPRATGDLDVWVDPTPENAARVMGALDQFGAPLGQVTADDFSRPGIVFQMGLPPLRIDVLTELTGLTFDESWPGRTSAGFGPLNRMRTIGANVLATGGSGRATFFGGGGIGVLAYDRSFNDNASGCDAGVASFCTPKESTFSSDGFTGQGVAEVDVAVIPRVHAFGRYLLVLPLSDPTFGMAASAAASA